jgi:hypothetical protein
MNGLIAEDCVNVVQKFQGTKVTPFDKPKDALFRP